MSDPWSNIAASGQVGIDNLRRASAEHPLEFWWGRDHSGRCLLALDYAVAKSRPQFPELAGLEIVTFSRDAKVGRLVLTLVDDTDRDIFLALCNDMIHATSSLGRGDSQNGVLIVIARLARWRELFRNRRDRLSFERVIGLAGELFFLRDCLLSRLDAATAVSMWRGPYGDEQDFVVGRSIIEVKTQLSTADAKLQISSENQLDTTSGAVILVHQLLGQALPSTEHALSLNKLAADIRGMISAVSPASADTFDSGLLAAGYVPLAPYDEPFWILARRDVYRVEQAFPRIIPTMLPTGVEKVRYHLRLDACLPFQVDATQTLEALLNE
ncbi:PD-(D/E)XK motif protein [Gemmobacter caeruleus]|uniref:PD-(D/E)XK motif protein n=1 Tax=Gemmobacter caeruleus TaxID=2595004 RepID=UPI0011EEA13D|nr:PD-(D/E)XK motif protein [Gemmobacter caeruleus]